MVSGVLGPGVNTATRFRDNGHPPVTRIVARSAAIR